MRKFNQLAYGTKVEMEHAKTIKRFMKKGTSPMIVASSIARDHLKENKNYYKILRKEKL